MIRFLPCFLIIHSVSVFKKQYEISISYALRTGFFPFLLKIAQNLLECLSQDLQKYFRISTMYFVSCNTTT